MSDVFPMHGSLFFKPVLVRQLSVCRWSTRSNYLSVETVVERTGKLPPMSRRLTTGAGAAEARLAAASMTHATI